MKKNRIIIICGSTATGKTNLALKIAKKIDGELVSFDSRQVYKSLDIGTGKDIGNLKYQESNIKNPQNNNFQIGYYIKNGIKIWLYDIVNPDFKFNVSDYVQCANLVLADILKRKKIPILVGGTGFYLKGLIDGFLTLGIFPDWSLRKKLGNYSLVRLQDLLKKQDFDKWKNLNKSDRNNPRRLIRAIEITRNSKNENQNIQNLVLHLENIKKIFIGLTAPYSFIYQKINLRIKKRVKEGIVQEITKLISRGYNFDNSSLGTTLGYYQWHEYFAQKKGIDEVIKRWEFDEHGYCRRQMTWFKKDKRIKWFDIQKSNYQSDIFKLINI